MIFSDETLKQRPSKFPYCNEKFSHFKLDLSPYFAVCFGLGDWFLISVGLINLGLI